jgi:glycerol-3-phosphate acyltransferase PlsY
MNGMRLVYALVAAYLLGALPVGYAITWVARKVDIRTMGSGHTGGTNVLRVAGALPAALTVLCDAAKGYGAVALARSFVPGVSWVAVLAGVATVLGHNHSVFLAFRGGVGTMTTFGAALALMPWAAVGAALAGLAVVIARRYASLGSLTFAAAVPVACLIGACLGAWPWVNLLFAVLSGLFSTWELRHNIQRLRQGAERKIGQGAESPAGPSASG